MGEAAVDEAGGSIDGLEDPAPLELERLRLLALPLAASSAFLPPTLLVLVLPFRLPPEVMTSLAGLGGAGSPPPPLPTTPRRPLAPLRSLLCIGLNEASPRPATPPPLPPPVGTGVLEAARPLLARPFGALDSASLVGESQNLNHQRGFIDKIGILTDEKAFSCCYTLVEPSHFWCNPSEFQRMFCLST